MPEPSDVYLALYTENCQQGRHHEEQRAALTNVVLVVAGAFTAIIAFDDQVNYADRPMAIFIIVLGLYGAVGSAKHYERFRAHMQRARGFRSRLDLSSSLALQKIKEDADRAHRNEYRLLSRIRLWWVWCFLHVFISALGVHLLWCASCVE